VYTTEFYETLLSASSKEEIFRICFNLAKKLFNPDAGRVYLFNETRDFLVNRFKYGQSYNIDGDDKISSSQFKSIIVRTAIENSFQIIEDTSKDRRVEKRIMQKFNIKSIIAIPIEIMGITQGTITFDFKKKLNFDESKFDELITFIKTASLIIERVELIKKVTTLDNQMKEELEKMSLKLEQANEKLLISGRMSALGQLASGVAHEIKNPLAVIKMLIDTLDNEEDKGNKFKDDIKVIKSEIIRLEDIVNHFLNFARPKKIQKTDENINDLITEVVDFLKIKFQNIDVKLDLYTAIKNILIDRNQMKQVFINILLNAIEACKNINSPVIEINTSIISRPEGRYIKIVVLDNGKGIQEDIIDRIFEPFTTTRDDGLGLGLSITYRIIADHGGNIVAMNRLTGGAKFDITFPEKTSMIN